MKRHIRITALPALLALAAFLAACALPPYNQDLSLAQVTRSKLGAPVNTIGPIYAKLDDSAMENRFYFLPDRDDPANSGGFLVAEASYGLRLWYLADYSMGLEASWSIDLANSSETTNNFLLQPLDSGAVDTNYFLILIRYQQDDLRLIHSSGTASVSQYTTELPLLTNLPSAMNVLGSSISADSTSGSDLQFFLASQGTTYYAEYGAQTDTADGFTLISSSLPTDLGPVPDGLTSAFYAHDPVLDRSYLSRWSGSSYSTYAWNWDHEATGIAANGFQQLTGIKGPVNAVLTSGQLLSFADNSCTVYGPAGWKQYKFPMGGLKFCYESIDAGVPTLYFSLAYWQYGKDEEADELYVEVYAIRTANLKNLN
jgi:hypothetical protein